MEEINAYGFVYVTTNIINGKKYIGQRRYSSGWKKYLGSGISFKKAIKKYGRESFIREIVLDAFSKEELNILEIKFIKIFNAAEDENYYNIAYGGGASMSGLRHSQETKDKFKNRIITELHKKNLSKSHKGYITTKEQREKMSSSHMGHIVSTETRQKIGDSNRGKIRSEELRNNNSKSQLGKILSKETRLKMSIARRRIEVNTAVEIREKYATGNYSQRKLAEIYSITHNTIGNIVRFEGTYKKDKQQLALAL